MHTKSTIVLCFLYASQLIQDINHDYYSIMYKVNNYNGIKDTDRIHHFHLNRTYDIIAAIIKKYTSAGNESINISLLINELYIESNESSSGSVEYKLQRETDIITMGYQV